MHFLIRAAMLLAAGAAGWALAKRNSGRKTPEDPQVVYLEDKDAVIDSGEGPCEPREASARVKACYRRMDPLTLNAGNEAIFMLEDGEEIKLNFTGEGGLHLREGEQGLLTWQGMRLIRFEKENGDVIGGMFYVPAGEEEDDA